MKTKSISIFITLFALFTLSLSCMVDEQKHKEMKLKLINAGDLRTSTPEPEENQLKALAFTAASRSNLICLQHLINEEGIDPNSLDKNGTSLLQAALCDAFERKNPAASNPVLEFLTQKKAFINRCKPGQNISAIIFATSIAMREDYLPPLEFLLSKAANPFFKERKEKNSAAFNLTVARTVPPDQTKGLSKVAALFATKATTLAHALELCDLSLVKKFVTPKTVHEKDAAGRLPLEILVQIWDKKIPYCTEIADMLFANGANPYAIITEIGTPCSIFATCKTIKQEDIDLLKLFLKNGVNPDYRPFARSPSVLDMVFGMESLNGESPFIQEVKALLANHR